MNFLKRILKKDERFYDLLEASADEARNSASRLEAFLKDFDTVHSRQSLDDFIVSRRKDKKIRQELTEHLCRTFVTPLEREDIEALSNSLYKIPKTVLKIGERMVICQVDLRQDASIQRQVGLLVQASETVTQMVRLLRRGADLNEIRDLYAKLQHFEGEADKMVIGMLKELCDGTRNPVDVIMLKDIYELLERSIDRCRDAGNTVFEVVLKNS